MQFPVREECFKLFFFDQSSLFHKKQPSMYPVAFDGILVIPIPK